MFHRKDFKNLTLKWRSFQEMGFSQKNWLRVFTKICNFPYFMYDLKKYLSSSSKHAQVKTRVQELIRMYDQIS